MLQTRDFVTIDERRRGSLGFYGRRLEDSEIRGERLTPAHLAE